jgi:hypothetical protein
VLGFLGVLLVVLETAVLALWPGLLFFVRAMFHSFGNREKKLQ